MNPASNLVETNTTKNPQFIKFLEDLPPEQIKNTTQNPWPKVKETKNPWEKEENPVDFKEFVPENQKTLSLAESLSNRIVKQLDKVDHFLDTKLPNNSTQSKIDSINAFIDKKLAPLKKFNEWLDNNGHGHWTLQLATFLAKLPVRVVRNVVKLIYNIIKGCIYSVTHPLKAVNNLVKLLVRLAAELTKPETWSRIGAGMIGASIGQSLITGNPLSIIGIGIGAAMLVGGLSVGALMAAIKSRSDKQDNAALNHFIDEAKKLPEHLLTGLCIGLLIGAIHNVFRGSPSSPNDGPAPMPNEDPNVFPQLEDIYGYRIFMDKLHMKNFENWLRHYFPERFSGQHDPIVWENPFVKPIPIPEANPLPVEPEITIPLEPVVIPLPVEPEAIPLDPESVPIQIGMHG